MDEQSAPRGETNATNGNGSWDGGGYMDKAAMQWMVELSQPNDEVKVRVAPPWRFGFEEKGITGTIASS